MSHDLITGEYVQRTDARDTDRQQHVTFESHTGSWRLEPAEHVSGDCPFAEPVYVVSAWNPNGFPASWDQNSRYGDELESRVVVGGGSATDVVVHARERTWFERALLVSSVERHFVLELAADFRRRRLRGLDTDRAADPSREQNDRCDGFVVVAATGESDVCAQRGRTTRRALHTQGRPLGGRVDEVGPRIPARRRPDTRVPSTSGNCEVTGSELIDLPQPAQVAAGQ